MQKEGDGKKQKSQSNTDVLLLKLGNSSVNLNDINSFSNLERLNLHLSEFSYINGYVATQEDVKAYDALKSPPPNNLPHCIRWYKHIQSFAEEREGFSQVRQHSQLEPECALHASLMPPVVYPLDLLDIIHYHFYFLV